MKRFITLAVLFGVLWVALAVGIHSVTQNNTLGSDFYIFWNAGRAAVFEHANPYSDELALQAQLAVFKRPAAPEEDQLGFAYPLYALIVILPLLCLPFDWAQACWISFLILGLVSAGAASLPRARRWVPLTFLFFYPTIFGVLLGNYAIMVGSLLLLVFGIFFQMEHPDRNMQIAFGICAAWMTIKPQFLWLYLVFILIFALRKQLKWFLLSAAVSLGLFLLFSFALLPYWLGWWFESLGKYSQYTQIYPVLTYLIAEMMPFSVANWIVAGLALIGMGVTVKLIVRWWSGNLSLLSLLAWLGLCAALLHPRGKSYDHLVYLLPLWFWAGQQMDWRRFGLNLFWWGSVVASWVVFVISKGAGAPDSLTEWPVLFHAVWVVWMLGKSRQANLAQV